MKTRNGFVSNSSSSSFVINKDLITPFQICMIKNYQVAARIIDNHDAEEGDRGEFGWVDDYWRIEETEDELIGRTSMDNFNMDAFLVRIQVPSEAVIWSE